MRCTTCDTLNEETARFCQGCGAVLAGAAPRYFVTRTPMTGALCPSCKKRNPEGARYCVYCATAFQQASEAVYVAPGAQPAPAGGAAAMTAPVQPFALTSNDAGSLLVRALWFVLIGWWLSLVWTVIAWLFNLTLIGLPVGVMMLNAIPQVTTLQHAKRPTTYSAHTPTVEHPLALRAIWFILVGWWASLLWMLAAWGFCSTILLMPLAFWMFDRVPTITTLAADR